MDIKIETSRLILRPFIESDAAAAIYNSRQPSVAHYMPGMGRTKSLQAGADGRVL